MGESMLHLPWALRDLRPLQDNALLSQWPQGCRRARQLHIRANDYLIWDAQFVVAPGSMFCKRILIFGTLFHFLTRNEEPLNVGIYISSVNDHILFNYTSQELRMLSRSLSDCQSLTLYHNSSFTLCQDYSTVSPSPNCSQYLCLCFWCCRCRCLLINCLKGHVSTTALRCSEGAEIKSLTDSLSDKVTYSAVLDAYFPIVYEHVHIHTC